MDVTHITRGSECKNTCFLIASLQALLANVDLRNGVLELDHNYQNCQDFGTDNKNCFLCHFVEIANKANIQQKNKWEEVSCTSMYHLLGELGLTEGEEHDAHEYIVQLLEKLQSVEVPNQTRNAKSLIEKLFSMKCVIKVACSQCGAETPQPETHPCISVEIKENLKESIQSFFKEEKVEGRICQRCETTCAARKSSEVQDLSSHLFIQIKRFRYESAPEKIIEPAMTLPVIINSKDFVTSKENVCYQLYCFIVHVGSTPSSGHYVAYRKSGQNWYRCNDVQPPEKKAINSRHELELERNETAYLLFYKKCDGSLLNSKVAVLIKEVLGAEDTRNCNANDVKDKRDIDIPTALDDMSLSQQPEDLLRMNRFESLVDAPSQPNGTGKKSDLPNTAPQPNSVGGESQRNPEQQNVSHQLNGAGDGSEGNDKPTNATPRTIGVQAGSKGSKWESQDSPFQQNAGVPGSGGDCERQKTPELQESSGPAERKVISGNQVLRQLKETFPGKPEQDAEGRIDGTIRNNIPKEGSNNSASTNEHRPIPGFGRPGSNGTPALVSPEINIKLRPKIEAAAKVKQWTDFFIKKYSECAETLEHELKVSVLPVGACLTDVLRGSLKLAIQVTSSKALEELWDKFECGVLKASMERVFATEDVKRLINCQEMELDIDIKKEEYESAREMLIKSEMQDVPLSSVVDNPALMDELGGCLDRPYHVIKYWRHLAYELEVPPIISRQFELYSAHSPSVELFEYLKIENAGLTIKDLKEKLGKIYRNDLIKILNEAQLRPNDKVCDAVTDNTNLLERISLELDTGVKPVGNWRSLAGHLRIPMRRVYQFEMYSSQNPTAQLFRYLAKFQKHLTVEILKTHLKELSRNDVLLEMEKFRLKDDDLVKRVIGPESNVSIALEELLNKDIAGFGKSWRKLANRLNVPHDEYDRWDDASDRTRHSPTKQLLEWLRAARVSLSLTELANALHKMDRNDAVVILTKHIPNIARRSQEEPPSSQNDFNGDVEVTDSLGDQRRMEPAFSSQPVSSDGRRSMNVSKLPYEIYGKLCRKLDIKRDLSYDDYRMLGEKIGLDRDLIEYVGQRSNPTSEILNKWSARNGAQASVGKLIEILNAIERADAAELLEDWVDPQTQ